MGGAIVSLAPVVCVGPVKYRGEKLVQTDIDEREGRSRGRRRRQRACLPAGNCAVRRRHERILQDPTKNIFMRSPPS